MHVFAFSNSMEIQNNERQLKENWYLFDIKGELVCQILLGNVWINVWSLDKSDSSGGARDSSRGRVPVYQTILYRPKICL